MSGLGKTAMVKVCGLMRPGDIEAVNAARPDYAGFILSPGYRRSIDERRAARLSSLLDDGIGAVGVFVDDDPSRIASLVARGVIDVIQLHGSEDDSYIAELRALLSDEGAEQVWIIKVFEPANREEAESALASTADMVMFDAGRGSGVNLDWTMLAGLPGEFMLAGGLHAGNVVEALAQTNAAGVDTSSGVESNGAKDPRKVAAFLKAARSFSRGAWSTTIER